MKSFEEFQQYFDESVKGDLTDLEGKRAYMHGRRIYLLGINAAFILSNLYLVIIQALHPYTLIFTVIATPIITYIIYKKLYLNSTIPDEYKDIVVKRMLEFVDPSLNYKADGFIDFEDFMASELFLKRPDHYEGDDFIEGAIDGIPIKLSELHVMYEARDSKRKEKKKRWVNQFDGIFLVAEYPKEIDGKMFILPDKLQKNMGHLGMLVHKNNLLRGNYIRPTNEKFRNQFVVYADNLLEGEAMLSEDLMDKMLALRRRNGGDVYASIIGNKISVAVTLQGELFKVDTTKPFFTPSFVREFYDEIFYLFGIVDDLNIDELELPSKEAAEENNSEK